MCINNFGLFIYLFIVIHREKKNKPTIIGACSVIWLKENYQLVGADTRCPVGAQLSNGCLILVNVSNNYNKYRNLFLNEVQIKSK
jgi:hypothetical protein